MKYKVGDKVKSIKNFRIGAIGTVIGILGAHSVRVEYEDGFINRRATDCIELVEAAKILITRDGDKPLARLYEADKVIKSAEAKCSPSDTYDFTIGANLAYDRLMRPTVPTATEPAYREVKRAAKVGEKIKVGKAVSAKGLYSEGDTLSVVGTNSIGVYVDVDLNGRQGNASGGTKVYLYDEEYVTLEPLFDWEAFKSGKIAVHCDTEDKAKTFLKECDAQGIRWCSGGKASDEAHYIYGSRQAYCCYSSNAKLEFGSAEFYKGKGKTIIESPFSEPSLKITVTHQMLVDLKACSAGLRDFGLRFPDGTDYDTLIADHEKRGERDRAGWLERRKQQIIDWKPVEYYNGKVVCLRWGGDYFTPNVIYSVINGRMRTNKGEETRLFRSFGEIENYCGGKFAEIKGEQS